MVQQSWSNERLRKIGKLNYQKLGEICETISLSGYWEQPQKILNMPIHQMLDMYLQAVLVQVALRAGGFVAEQREFVTSVLDSDPYGINEEQILVADSKQAMKRVMSSPPIILELCGVYDMEHHEKMSSIAFDCFLNMVLAIIYVNNGKTNETLKVAEDYYEHVSIFLNPREAKEILNHRYWFKKISEDGLDFGFYERTVSENSFQSVKMRQQERVESLKQQMQGFEETEQSKTEEPIEERKETELSKEDLESYLEELNELIGLEGVKKEITSLVNLIKVRRMRERYHMPVTDMSCHMVFTGNPGTGKTTVARLVAKILKELGILSKGHLVETDRAGLVAGYVGQTALKVKEVVDQSVGGILFIDEAYSLSNQTTGNDFGQEAIDALVKLMEDNRNDLVVIVAGYRDEMEQFLHANPGLISRFNKFIEFADYTCWELMDILEYMSGKDGISLTKEAKQDILYQIMNMEEKERFAFGNARGIRNLFEKMLLNQANRLVGSEKEPTKEELEMLTAEDVCGILTTKRPEGKDMRDDRES